jgi:hypothetical protein
MATTTYASRLRYLDADDVDDSVVDFDGLDVLDSNDERLGEIDGFIVHSDSRRVLYAVVNSGGWFSSQRFLLPIGHLGPIDRNSGSILSDLTRSALRSYPEFDGDRFREFTDDELRDFEVRTAAACCPGDSVVGTAWGYESRAHYRQPEWWNAESYRRERAPLGEPTPPAVPPPAPETVERERVTARAGDDVSPHYDGRAQPGDVLGIETGGETTAIGETSSDENRRRREAERDAPRDTPSQRRA